jgi:hypothetical protein
VVLDLDELEPRPQQLERLGRCLTGSPGVRGVPDHLRVVARDLAVEQRAEGGDAPAGRVRVVGLQQHADVGGRLRDPVHRPQLARRRLAGGVRIVAHEHPDAAGAEVVRQFEVLGQRLLLDAAQVHVAVDREDLQAGVLDPAAQRAALGRGQSDVRELFVGGPQFQAGDLVRVGEFEDGVERCAGAAERGEGQGHVT